MENQNSETVENTVYENIVETQPEKKKKHTSWVVAGLLLVVLLAGAAFVGGSLLRKQSAQVPDITFGFTPAKEVPQTKPELMGTVTKVDGDTLSVEAFDMNDLMGEGGVMSEESSLMAADVGSSVSVGESEGEEEVPEFFGSGAPVTEVVITHDTKIYKDTTWESFGFSDVDESAETSNTIEQKVEPGPANEIGTSAMVTVWGERRGDRVVATFILYEAPMDFGDEAFNNQ
jgi:hypothetical protein